MKQIGKYISDNYDSPGIHEIKDIIRKRER